MSLAHRGGHTEALGPIRDTHTRRRRTVFAARLIGVLAGDQVDCVGRPQHHVLRRDAAAGNGQVACAGHRVAVGVLGAGGDQRRLAAGHQRAALVAGGVFGRGALALAGAPRQRHRDLVHRFLAAQGVPCVVQAAAHRHAVEHRGSRILGIGRVLHLRRGRLHQPRRAAGQAEREAAALGDVRFVVMRRARRRVDRHVAADRGQVAAGHGLAAGHVQVAAGLERDVAVGAADQAAGIGVGVVVGNVRLLLVAVGQTVTRGAEAALLLLAVVRFAAAGLRGGNGQIVARSQAGAVGAGYRAARHGQVVARLDGDGIAREGGTGRIGPRYRIDGVCRLGRHEAGFLLEVLVPHVLMALAGVEMDVPPGHHLDAAGRVGVGRRGTHILPGADRELAARLDLRAGIRIRRAVRAVLVAPVDVLLARLPQRVQVDVAVGRDGGVA
ncbi:hypothetical protein GO287_04915 [Ralstonia solanacearum]|nr:hypothetical protein [Ralstonia solanacearum]